MANTYLISDAYFKEQYPEHTGFNMDKFYSILLIEQKTSLESIIGEKLYAWLIENIQNLSNDGKILLQQVQYLLVFLVARQFTVLNVRDAGTEMQKDNVWQALTGKISYLKTKLKTFIQNSEELSGIANDDASTTNTYGEFPLYFPR